MNIVFDSPWISQYCFILSSGLCRNKIKLYTMAKDAINKRTARLCRNSCNDKTQKNYINLVICACDINSAKHAVWLPIILTSLATPLHPGTKPLCLRTNWITPSDVINLEMEIKCDILLLKYNLKG